MGRYRKITQWFFFIIMFLIPVLNILEIYFIKGTYISMDVGSLAVSDPLAVLQALLASHEVRAVMITSVALPVLIALILGRVWCGWACPYFLITEGLEALRKVLKLKSLKPAYDSRRPGKANIIRFCFLIAGLIFTGIAGVPLLYLISPPSVLSAEAIMLVKHFTLTAEFILIPILLLVEFLFVYRFWCRYFCPTGACLSLFKTNRGMGVDYSGQCSDCGKCVKVCTMALDPRKDGRNSQCVNCGVCIDKCPDNKKHETLNFRIK